MKSHITILVLILLTACTSKNNREQKSANSKIPQHQSILKNYVRNSEVANVISSEIDSLKEKMADRFLSLANDTSSQIQKEIQLFFDDFKTKENLDHYVYPIKLEEKHLYIQQVNFTSNYGWIGTKADSAFYSQELTALIIIPGIENLRKGQSVNSICFKMTIDFYSERNLRTEKAYHEEEKIIELRQLKLE